jgi:8-oxo-dGTP pyrophosphatase MutT (NUDIX family)
LKILVTGANGFIGSSLVNLLSKENPKQAARNELFEETGYLAKKLELLAVLNLDIGRLTNKLWSYLAKDLKQVKDWVPEDGIKLVKYPADQVYSLVKNGQLNKAFNLAALFLAVLKDVFTKI